MRNPNVLIFNTASSATVPNAPADASLTQTSIPIYIGNDFGWSSQIVFTGSPAGTVIAEASNDPQGSNPQSPGHEAPINWTPIANATFTIAAAGNCMFNVTEGYYGWIHFVWTPTSGTGTLTGRVQIKGV